MFRFVIIGVLTLLTSYGFLIAHENLPSESLVQLAVEYNDMDLVEIVMKYGNDFSYPAINKAMDEWDYTAVQILLEYGVNVNSRRDIYYLGSPSQHSNINGHGKTILEKAVEMENLAWVEYFISKQANPLNFRTVMQKSWWHASDMKRVEQIDSYTTTALYDAIKLGNVNIVIAMIESHIDLNAICYEESLSSGKNQLTLTPIQAAIRLNKRDIVSLLLSLGVKI